MADEVRMSSDLSNIAELNGNFRRNYGTLLGAILYLCSIRAARRASHWGGWIAAVAAAILTWVAKYLWSWSSSS